MDEAVRVEGLGKDFRHGFLMRPRPAVQSVTFTVPLGTTLGFLGPNGAGKTTTLNMILGLVRPSRGAALVFGRPPDDPLGRASVGFLAEAYAYDGFPTGESLLRRFDRLAGRPLEGRDRRVRSALEQVEMGWAARQRVGTYSKGMLQRLGLAQALLGEPDLLVLDEPMSGMDPATRHSVRELLRARKERGGASLFSTHILSDVEALADRVLIIDRGRTVAEGSLEELAAGSSGTVIVFLDHEPERFDPFLSERGMHREPAVDPPGAQQVLAVDSASRNAALAHLAGNGADVVSVMSRRAGLEEVFLRLTGGGAEARG